MVSIDDDAAPGIRIEQRRADDARLAWRERRHGIEQMGKAAYTVRNRRRGLRKIRVAVTRGNQYAAGSKLRNHRGRGHLRRQRQDRAAAA